MISENHVLYIVIDNGTCRIEESGAEPVSVGISADSHEAMCEEIGTAVAEYLRGCDPDPVQGLLKGSDHRHPSLVFGEQTVADLLDERTNCRILFRNGAVSCTGYVWSDINLSGLRTILIQSAGRYCTEYASDMLYVIEKIETMLENIGQPGEEGSRFVYTIGVRPSGVDDGVVLEKAIERGTTGDIYKQILAVEGECIPVYGGKAYELTVRLYDVTGALRTKERKEGRG